MRMVVISDTHNRMEDIIFPDGDILIHCGDSSNYGTFEELIDFWKHVKILSSRYDRIFLVAGNHDFFWVGNQGQVARSIFSQNSNVRYLEDDLETYKGLSFFGSPWTPEYKRWAFMVTNKEAKWKWYRMPICDVLISHGPPFGILDETRDGSMGCRALSRVVEDRCKINLFGHIHEARGVHKEKDVLFANTSSLEFTTGLMRAPIVIDVEKKDDAILYSVPTTF